MYFRSDKAWKVFVMSVIQFNRSSAHCVVGGNSWRVVMGLLLQLWETRINAASMEHGLPQPQLMEGLARVRHRVI